MFYSNNLKNNIRSILSWLIQILRFKFTLKSNYTLTRPRSLKTQIVKNNFNNKKIKILIESEIDYYVIEQIFVKEHYSLRKNPLWSQILEVYHILSTKNTGKPLILDCGANIGLSARYFNEEYPSATIVAVEPSTRNISIANKNLKDINNIFLLRAAIGCERGHCEIENNTEEPWAFQVTKNNSGEIPILTVSDLMSQFGGMNTPFLIKIDIEGYEQVLFSKNTDWMKLFPIIIIELHDWISPGNLISMPFLRQISLLDRDFYYNEENIISISVPLLDELIENSTQV